MKLRWLGHAAFRIETARQTILIDPFLTHNPSFAGQDIKDAVKGVTHILLTHGHMDHVGDTIALANELDAEVVANADLGDWLNYRGVKKINPGNTGGTIATGGFTVTFTQALHSSAHTTEDGVTHSLGNANGLVLHFDDEPTLYHWAIPTSSPTWRSSTSCTSRRSASCRSATVSPWAARWRHSPAAASSSSRR
jgi:L-ascorbate metabolism protein UlaG (beta-lactamase superfamily)